ncbi:MAG: glycoside hydrolase family 3 C-terminal domain-containing protein [Candidatus Aminicenantes bacterium]|nr:glycoside hydrolase family 3 C-terminal domain-containing protein [Candidatus Aminicenantes bacterium]
MSLTKLNIKAAIVTCLAFLTASCAPVAVKTDLAFGPSETRWVEKTLRQMTLEEKVGQLIACRYTGDFFNEESPYLANLKDLVVNRKIGGVIIFLGEAYETAHLNNALQKMAKIPLLISSDLERGTGNQITGATLFPTLMGVGAANSEELAYKMGQATAAEGRALGIHMTYAPVIDVNINPDNPIINTRAIGEDPEQVSRLASAFIKGCQSNGMIATAKHFPGHGDTDQDSHSLLPTIKADRERLDKVELYPYKKAIEAGVQAVMVSHLYVPALDPTPNLPASLSPAILTDLLRGKLGFRGLIVTDAMEMGGVTNSYSNTEAALQAILAGVDMVLLPLEPSKVVNFLVEAARSGRLPAARIEESVRRILEAKARLGLHLDKSVDVEALPKKLGTKASLEQARMTFERAVTLVKNDGGMLPLRDSASKISVLSLSSDQADYFAGRVFADAIRKRSPGAQVFYADTNTGKESLDDAFFKAAGTDIIICAVFSSLRAWKGSVGLDPRHVDLIKTLAATGKPVAVVNFGSPYLLRNIPEISSYMCLYRNTPIAQDIAARAIFGELDITGKLPVSIPGLYLIGQGVELKKIR